MRYRETQWLFLGRLWAALAIPPVVVSALLAWRATTGKPVPGLSATTADLTALAVLVWLVFIRLVTVRLAVEVRESELRIRFKGMFFRRRVPLSEIATAEAVRYNAARDFGGYGVRSTGNGRAYIASGSEAVECHLRDGSVVILGTQHPLALRDAIRNERP